MVTSDSRKRTTMDTKREERGSASTYPTQELALLVPAFGFRVQDIVRDVDLHEIQLLGHDDKDEVMAEQMMRVKGGPDGRSSSEQGLGSSGIATALNC